MTAAGMVAAHPATDGERAQVVTTLCKAFFDDRIYRWLVPDDAQRRRSASVFYSSFVNACWPHGGVYAAGGGSGAALWLPPGEQLVTEEDAERFGRELVESAGDEASAARMTQLFAVLDDNHPTDDCWYLAFMGVEPAGQGQGIGTALLAAVLSQADRDHMPAYLEASCPENRRIYERHGFELVRELTVADSPALYAMWRRPFEVG
ncbi:GNAT family N-acetyltransferase [Mycobacterium sp. NPDC050041]|uniref:GNAT family N-acetyltransferase n=1 Tax=Mycobacterium sp. NPDC050041 TaxID=3364293 RepID=UPI003C2C493C